MPEAPGGLGGKGSKRGQGEREAQGEREGARGRVTLVKLSLPDILNMFMISKPSFELQSLEGICLHRITTSCC